MATFYLTSEEAAQNSKWWVVDASQVPMGRLASEVAVLIRGKHKPDFTPHVNGGDFVVVVNADKVVLTGSKPAKKMVRKHTGYMGGLKEISAGKLLDKKPEFLIEKAVAGMLPSGVLGHRMMSKLKIYHGTEHPHEAQSPQAFELRYNKNKNKA